MTQREVKLGVVVVVVAALAVGSLAFASQGVRGDDSAYGTAQPDADEVTRELEVRAAYDDDDIYWRLEWETENPGFHHDFLVYEDGEWERYGADADGTGEGFNEDRITFLMDDGSVDGFDEYGGFLTVHSFTREMSPEDIEGEEVEEVYGEGTDDLRKQIPGTLADPTDWSSRLDDDEIDDLQASGYFLDLWHWRAHRSNPIGYSDAQHVTDHRHSDDGEGPYATNWDDDADQPELMFDPDAAGQHAMDWDRVLDLDYGPDDQYYLSEDLATEFDPDHDWQEGDTIPRRVLSEPEGSRGQIFAQGVATDDRWEVELQRALDTGYPEEDKVLEEFRSYDAAFAIHAGNTGNRWHFVGMPKTVGLGVDADIEAERVDGEPDWDAIEPTTITLFYPGVIGWDHIASTDSHGGGSQVQAGIPFEQQHEPEKMGLYALESEYRDEVISQWLLTIVAWSVLILGASFAFIRIASGWRPRAASASDQDREEV